MMVIDLLGSAGWNFQVHKGCKEDLRHNIKPLLAVR